MFLFLLIQILLYPIQRAIYSQSVISYLCFWSMVRSNIREAILKHKKQTKYVFQNYMKEGSLEIAAFFYITVVILAYLLNRIKPSGRQSNSAGWGYGKVPEPLCQLNVIRHLGWLFSGNSSEIRTLIIFILTNQNSILEKCFADLHYPKSYYKIFPVTQNINFSYIYYDGWLLTLYLSLHFLEKFFLLCISWLASW